MFNDLKGFCEVFGSKCEKGSSMSYDNRYTFQCDYFCPKCGDVRHGEAVPKCSFSFTITKDDNLEVSLKLKSSTPLYELRCYQCQSISYLFIYNSFDGVKFMTIHTVDGGCHTPNTPDEIKYYLDQAFKAKNIDAVTASAAMYRSALEWLLHDQGYTRGMLGSKIQKLEDDVKNNYNLAPKWIFEIPSDFLQAIKEIGNGAIHTNGGDISKQKQIDADLLQLIDIIFAELLDKIYEQPIRSKNNLAKLKSISFKP